MRKFRVLALVIFIHIFIPCLSSELVFASDSVGDQGMGKTEIRSIHYAADHIVEAELTWSGRHRILLTSDQIITLAGMLREVENDDISPYEGPLPKGGPTSINFTLDTNEEFTIILNGRYILFDESQIYQPELSEYVKQVKLTPNSSRYNNTPGL
jgi:hypothetical protein